MDWTNDLDEQLGQLPSSCPWLFRSRCFSRSSARWTSCSPLRHHPPLQYQRSLMYRERGTVGPLF